MSKSDPTPLQPPTAVSGRASGRRRWIGAAIVILLVLGLLVLAAIDLFDIAPVKIIGLNLQILREATAAQPVLAAITYCLFYMTLAALFLPGSPLMTVIARVLFGSVFGFGVALIGTTLAAITGFLVARLIGARRADGVSHPAFIALRDGFKRQALSYMLFLRLSPGLPVALVNAAPAVLGVRLSTFVLGTFVGLMPSRIALSTAGAGLGHVIEAQNTLYSQCIAANAGDDASCPYVIDAASLLTWPTLVAFLALALLALVPAIRDAIARTRAGVVAQPRREP